VNDLERDNITPPSARPTPTRDLSWESELVQLLSTLESFRTRLHADCEAGRELPAVETMLAVGRGVAAFVAARFGDERAAVQEAGDRFFAAAKPLYDRLDDNVFKMLVRLFWRRRDSRDPREQFHAVLCKLREFLKVAFDLCALRFLSPAAARGWTETYTVFLVELDALAELVGA